MQMVDLTKMDVWSSQVWDIIWAPLVPRPAQCEEHDSTDMPREKSQVDVAGESRESCDVLNLISSLSPKTKPNHGITSSQIRRPSGAVWFYFARLLLLLLSNILLSLSPCTTVGLCSEMKCIHP